jgi:oxalate decarboxylase
MHKPSRHVSSLKAGKPIYEGELGSVTALTADNFPILNRLSIKRLVLAPGAIREPHWHANASELAYCLAGNLLISVLDNESQFSVFTLGAGQMFHVTSGSLHAIENVGNDTAELIIAFRHERPEDFSLHAAFGAMTDAVLGNTYDLPASAFAPLRRDTSAPYLVKREGAVSVPSSAGFRDPHKFDIEAQSAPVASPVGAARTAKEMFWPALKDISMFSLRIEEDGMREPHWHPATAEMGYIHQGRARMTLLDPNGTTDTYELQPGDVYFIPRAYPHHIEVIGDEQIHFLIFFDQPTPGDIGFRASASLVAPEVLAATFGVPAAAFPKLPFTPADPLIVQRENPVDPET